MPKCPEFDVCPISNEWLNASPEVIDVMMSNFCEDRFTECVVYKAKIGDGLETDGGGAFLPGERKAICPAA